MMESRKMTTLEDISAIIKVMDKQSAPKEPRGMYATESEWHKIEIEGDSWTPEEIENRDENGYIGMKSNLKCYVLG